MGQAICIHCGKPIFDNGTVYVHHRLLGIVNGCITVLHTQWCDEDTKKYIAETEFTTDAICEVSPKALEQTHQAAQMARRRVRDSSI